MQDPEVEHLRPHKGGKHPELVGDWNNLFYSCGHCNSVKNHARYDEGIIDCCSSDPEELLAQELEENKVRVRVLAEGNADAARTAELIQDVFSAGRTGIRCIAADERLGALQLRMNMLYTKLDEYQKNKDALSRRTVSVLLRREEPFAGFTRCYVREHLDEYPEFAEDVA